MPVFQCDPNVELNGHSAYAFLNSVLHSEFSEIVAQHGLNAINREAWYPVRDVLAVLEAIANTPNATVSLVSIGMAAAENVALPPEALSLTPDQFFVLYEQLYPARHRNGHAGTVRAAVLGPRAATLTLDADVPYPDDVMYGVLYAYIHRLEPVLDFMLDYAPGAPRRDQGGAETVLRVSWVG